MANGTRTIDPVIGDTTFGYTSPVLPRHTSGYRGLT